MYCIVLTNCGNKCFNVFSMFSMFPASQRLGKREEPWQVFLEMLLLGSCFRGFVLPVLEYCADTHLKLLNCSVSGALFFTGVCLIVTLLIVDLWLYCACWIRPGVTRCTLSIRCCPCAVSLNIINNTWWQERSNIISVPILLELLSFVPHHSTSSFNSIDHSIRDE